jgi:hypothetical protein
LDYSELDREFTAGIIRETADGDELLIPVNPATHSMTNRPPIPTETLPANLVNLPFI